MCRVDRTHRNAVLLAMEHQGRTIHVLVTHITRRYDSERQAQLRSVIAMYLSLDEPALLLGDMNSDAKDPQIRQLLQTPGITDPVGEGLGGTPRTQSGGFCVTVWARHVR